MRMGAIISAVVAGVAMLTPHEPRAGTASKCLTEALYFEARSEGWRGMLAVGVVIQNRVKHKSYPDTVCGVVRQGQYWQGNPIRNRCQFSYYCDGKRETPDDRSAWLAASNVAKMLMTTPVSVVGLENSTHYHTVSVRPDWSKRLQRSGKIGRHIFYHH
jgi:spore germination cell wall hydrolase CwlJ-like protein